MAQKVATVFWRIRREIARLLVKGQRMRNTRTHYLEHKERARVLVGELIHLANAHYRLPHGRVAIRDQRRRWGSCSRKGNLNFNYRLLFLPRHLALYVVVHELCHLSAFDHSRDFWRRVEELIPDHRAHRKELRMHARMLIQP